MSSERVLGPFLIFFSKLVSFKSTELVCTESNYLLVKIIIETEQHEDNFTFN